MESFICNQCVEKLAILNTEIKYQNLWINNKVRRDKTQFVCIFFHIC